MKKYKDFEKELEDNWWKKGVYYVGWLGVFNLIFWLSLLLTYNNNHMRNEPFFNKRVIYVWGCIMLAIVLLGLLSNLIDLF